MNSKNPDASPPPSNPASPPNQSPSQPPKPPPTSSPNPPHQPTPKDTLITPTHIIFHSGPLSNWHISQPFTGRRALEILLPRLEYGGIDHPSRTTLSTRLLQRHDFNCGEQFMMACKAWLFERDLQLETELEALYRSEIDDLCEKLLPRHPQSQSQPRHHRNQHTSSPPPASHPTSSQTHLSKIKESNTTLLSILSTPEPRVQKSLGRQTQNFVNDIWTLASTHVVVSACISRAEVDAEVMELYIFAGEGESPPPEGGNFGAERLAEKERDDGVTASDDVESATHSGGKDSRPKRTFVEGSPVDCIWGVGVKWDDPRCDDQGCWRGENRLGRCHDEAAGVVREGMIMVGL